MEIRYADINELDIQLYERILKFIAISKYSCHNQTKKKTKENYMMHWYIRCDIKGQ